MNELPQLDKNKNLLIAPIEDLNKFETIVGNLKGNKTCRKKNLSYFLIVISYIRNLS